MKKSRLLPKKKNQNSLRSVKTDLYTITSGYLDVGNGHSVYFEQWGNPRAKMPILMFHGGPGGQFKGTHKSNFDPKRHQLIFFDQRGCGNSLPYGELKNNTTSDLIEDAARLLEFLNTRKVNVFGGSWGATLALLFAIEYPKYVKNVLAAGIFTGSQAEIDYVDKGLFERHYPEVWERFVSSVPKQYSKEPAAFHYKILNGNNESAHEASALALEDLEMPLIRFDWRGYSTILPDKDPRSIELPYDYVPFRIYAHYLSKGCFLPAGYILKNAHRIKAPLFLVQGRYDMVCPPNTAHKVHKAVKGSKLFMTLSSHDHDPENRSVIKTIIETVF